MQCPVAHSSQQQCAEPAGPRGFLYTFFLSFLAHTEYDCTTVLATDRALGLAPPVNFQALRGGSCPP